MADDYQQGFQDGWKAATEAVMRNRDHFRGLIGLPPETHEEAMKRIYETPRREGRGDTNVDKVVDTMADAVDLYVVLPPDIVVAPPPRTP